MKEHDLYLYLEGICDYFKKRIDNGLCLCELKKLNYDSDKFPDYSDIDIQLLYILRYGYSYTFEYFNIFEDIINKIEKNECRINEDYKLRIVSLGCGSAFDYLGAKIALRNYYGKDNRLRYTGIDINNWEKTWVTKKKEDKRKFIHNDILKVISTKNCVHCDVIIFPKSISEINSELLESICKEFERMNFSMNKFYIACSIRKNKKYNDKKRI